MSRIDNHTLSQLKSAGGNNNNSNSSSNNSSTAYPDLTEVSASAASGGDLLQLQQQRDLEVMLVARLRTIQGEQPLIAAHKYTVPVPAPTFPFPCAAMRLVYWD